MRRNPRKQHTEMSAEEREIHEERKAWRDRKRELAAMKTPQPQRKPKRPRFHKRAAGLRFQHGTVKIESANGDRIVFTTNPVHGARWTPTSYGDRINAGPLGAC